MPTLKKWLARTAPIVLVTAFCLPAPFAAGQEKEPEKETPRKESEDALTRALERRLAGRSTLDDVMIDIRWRFENEFASGRLFGDGVGVWNHSVGFRIPRAEARALIRKFEKAGFGTLPDSAGDEESRSITGRIIVSAGAVRKTVAQMADGPQSPLLSGLAESVLRVCKKAAADGGVRASSFEEGFAEQVSGKLGPGALDLRIFRKLAAGSPTPRAWELRIYGTYVYDRELGGAQGPDVTRQLHLPAADFQALVGELSNAGIGSLPGNLYAPMYTDLEVTLLNQHKNIQARDFSGMTPQTHGERQEAFDRLEKMLEALRGRVLKQGRRVEAVNLLGPGHEEHEREREKEKEGEKEKD